LVSGFGAGFSPVHTALLVGSGRFAMFQGVSGRRLMAMLITAESSVITRIPLLAQYINMGSTASIFYGP
jgi:hypothetical protein